MGIKSIEGYSEKRCTGVVDVLDESVFLVTLKSRCGKPVQLSFPLKMAVESGIQAGDFVSYQIVKENGKVTDKFVKEAPPELTDEELEEIDGIVSGIGED